MLLQQNKGATVEAVSPIGGGTLLHAAVGHGDAAILTSLHPRGKRAHLWAAEVYSLMRCRCIMVAEEGCKKAAERPLDRAAAIESRAAHTPLLWLC